MRAMNNQSQVNLTKLFWEFWDQFAQLTQVLQQKTSS